MLSHGGKLREASRTYQIPLDQWVDLSTGVNPRCYPIPEISVQAWNRLPEDDDGLVSAACDYYRCSSLLPVAGSQAAIQALPHIRRQFHPQSRKVAIPRVGYREHGHAWLKQGYEILAYDFEPTAEQLAEADVVLVINPNNPTGYFIDPHKLLGWHQQLSKRHAWLVVDEAFMDCSPDWSISSESNQQNLVVLRSVGKFFGLAGIRAGFVLARPEVLKAFQEYLGPWGVPGPSREVCTAAFRDVPWQAMNFAFLQEGSHRLKSLLEQYFKDVAGTMLFQRVLIDGADELHRELCQQGVFTRLLDEKNGVRFGLPGSETEWQRLEQCLQAVAINLG
ncbi:threonine-phosphate decarboxylase CobD [Parendozoicomonas haliclonae]|uniref:threonine-phosphate decarboxylase n=1 Tax=Parendozoicomonas haliclonae TaxID=1960125 RepID=A0A1X7ALV6_9GAMM|nr:threonine-phosphate decarboxylase CobD [Parendozoicomonas haliclonae]SMA48785.1 Threonine-phosphate decarboxylase [Parendozoicomonas haliclonae]